MMMLANGVIVVCMYQLQGVFIYRNMNFLWGKSGFDGLIAFFC
jgi:hypothetical protein